MHMLVWPHGAKGQHSLTSDPAEIVFTLVFLLSETIS